MAPLPLPSSSPPQLPRTAQSQTSLLSFFRRKTDTATTTAVETPSSPSASRHALTPPPSTSKVPALSSSPLLPPRAMSVNSTSTSTSMFTAVPSSSTTANFSDTLADLDDLRPVKRLRRRLVDESEDTVMDETSDPFDLDDHDVLAALDAIEQDMDTVSVAQTTPMDTTPAPAPTLLNKFAFDATNDGPTSSPGTTRTKSQMLKRPRLDDGEAPGLSSFHHASDDRYAFLKDIRDAEGRRPGDPNYENRTLYIPPSAWATFKPFERQYWEIKSKHFDTIVFFKKGFFYELYEVDADIGVREFELNYSKLARAGEMRLAGFPMSKIEEWAAKVIAKGYKVARVDELENSVTKNMREKKNGGQKDKIISRKLTSILTSGTLVYSSVLTDDMATYCVSIKEHYTSGINSRTSSRAFGVVVLDAATASFSFALLEDDNERTQLETLLMQMRPTELVCERGNLSSETMRLIKNVAKTPIINNLAKGTEFWDADTTENELRRHADYQFKAKDDDKSNESENESSSSSFFNNAPAEVVRDLEHPALLSAFGGMLWYLRSLKMDVEMLMQRRFNLFKPIAHSDTLILDGQTLANLDVLRNSTTGGSDGTLVSLLSHCATPMGKRLFQRWLCHPLRHVHSINQRLDAIEDIMNNTAFWGSIKNKLRLLPDLERILSRIRADNCKLNDFLQALEGFAFVQEIRNDLCEHTDEISAAQLRWLMERLPDCAKQLDIFGRAFDHALAKKEGHIVPRPGADEAYDKACELIDDIHARRDRHVEEQRKLLGTKDILCKDVGGDVFQLEVPKGCKKIPSSYIQMGGTSKVNRFWTPFLKELAVEFAEAHESRQEILRGVSSRIYGQFAHYEELWARAINVVSEVDCLLSLAQSSQMLGDDGCRPELVADSDTALFSAKELRHPTIRVSQFVPNDIALAGPAPSTILLTGPNMGGKSTLLRQTCIAIIMGQLGCYVPAKQCRLAPFDRIFTRIGAHDNILAGHSTFMVELQETSRILRNATPRSLVILDELGRGTSTFDGYAIAYAALSHIVSRLRALTLFATHYHGLTEEFGNNSLVALKHMACVVQDETREVIFLYKLTPGASTKSFGMHVASMAGVPTDVVDEAEKHAKEFERTYRLKETAALSSVHLSLGRKADVSCLARTTDPAVIRNIWRSLQTSAIM